MTDDYACITALFSAVLVSVDICVSYHSYALLL